MTEINKDQWLEWLEDSRTQKIIKELKELRDDLTDTLISSTDSGHTERVKGSVKALNSLLNYGKHPFLSSFDLISDSEEEQETGND
jgi:hypothetical protein